MLVYHFGSREGLMREILTGLREREDLAFASGLEVGQNHVACLIFCAGIGAG